jgi:hypothetical protein
MPARWRAVEDRELRRLYTSGIPLAAIATQLGRSEDAIGARRVALDLPARRRPPAWSPLADRVLREAVAAGLPATVIAHKLRRPVGQVRARRRQLGLARTAPRRYSASEDAAIRTAWAAGEPVERIARDLARTPAAVVLRARALGLHAPPMRLRWNRVEDDVVRDGYSDGLTCEAIARTLPGRTPAAVGARARKLGLSTYARRWSADDDHRLRRILTERSIDDAARMLGRTPEAIRQRARTLAIVATQSTSRPRSGARWTPAEDARLELHAALNPEALAALLGRSDRAIAARLRSLGLREDRERSPHHPVALTGTLSPGERALVQREIQARGDRAVVSLERRLNRNATALRAAVVSRRAS